MFFVFHLKAVNVEEIHSAPATPSSYITVLDRIAKEGQNTCDIECLLSMMSCLCETFYSFKHSSLAGMKTVFEKHKDELSQKSWFSSNSFSEKPWLKRKSIFGSQFAYDPEYGPTEILDIRDSILGSVSLILDSFMLQNSSSDELLQVIKDSFALLNTIKGKEDLNTSLESIEDYL
jgi:hypothetical protein